jgi:hypothetical protein
MSYPVLCPVDSPPYYNAIPLEIKSYPQTLDDLVNDTRFLFTKRHLRKIYPNPFTKKTDWNYTSSPLGGITGIEIRLNETDSKQFIFHHETTPNRLPPGKAIQNLQ